MNSNQEKVKENIVSVVRHGAIKLLEIDLTHYEIEQVLKNIYPRTATNQYGQPVGDYPDNIPTKEEFDKFHETPQGYGEEGEWLVVSKKFTQEQALEMIQKTLRDEWGWTGGEDGEGYYPNSVDDLASFDIGYGYDHDSYHYQEGGYWICSESNNITKRWEAWGIETQ